jgi:hypothetical protein
MMLPNYFYRSLQDERQAAWLIVTETFLEPQLNEQLQSIEHGAEEI